MGNSLSQEGLEAFSDELQKMAQSGFFGRLGTRLLKTFRNPAKLGLPVIKRVRGTTEGIFGSSGDVLNRLRHPIEGLREGWRASSPVYGMLDRAKKLGYGSIEEAVAGLKGKDPSAYKKLLGGGEHMLGTKPGTGRVQAAAEELSRRGWTGAGKYTKYIPWGNKGMATGFSAMAIPDIVNAPKATPTGGDSALERGIGELGSAAGIVAGTGLGFVPAMGMWYGGQRLGSRLGRVLDRVRSGASLKDAIVAPTPEEAAGQLETIHKYYG